MASQSGSVSRNDPPGPPLKPVSEASAPPTRPQIAISATPQRSDFSQRDVPRPTEVRGRRSPRLIMTSRRMAHIQMSDSFQIVPVKVRAGQMNEPSCRMTNSPKRATNRPIQVLNETLANGAGVVATVWSRMRQGGGLDSTFSSARGARAREEWRAIGDERQRDFPPFPR